jgi:hypothetical protein
MSRRIPLSIEFHPRGTGNQTERRERDRERTYLAMIIAAGGFPIVEVNWRQKNDKHPMSTAEEKGMQKGRDERQTIVLTTGPTGEQE